jgi:predicted transglutaminase-like cysteine proteinase
LRAFLLALILTSSATAGTIEDFKVMLIGAHTAHLDSIQRDTPFANEWNEWLDGVVRKPERRILQDVNFRFNRLRYQDDQSTWDAEDYWAAPEQFYAVGGGDCEDYAIAKYFALLELGFSRDNLAIALGMTDEGFHAVLTYWDGEDAWILDNMRSWPQRASKRKDFRVVGYVSI